MLIFLSVRGGGILQLTDIYDIDFHDGSFGNDGDSFFSDPQARYTLLRQNVDEHLVCHCRACFENSKGPECRHVRPQKSCETSRIWEDRGKNDENLITWYYFMEHQTKLHHSLSSQSAHKDHSMWTRTMSTYQVLLLATLTSKLETAAMSITPHSMGTKTLKLKEKTVKIITGNWTRRKREKAKERRPLWKACQEY